MSIIRINFLKDSADVQKFYLAMNHERVTMKIADLKVSTAKLEKKIANEKGEFDPEEIEGFKASLEKLNTKIDTLTVTKDETADAHSEVFAAMTMPNAEGKANTRDSVELMFRTLATVGEERLASQIKGSIFSDETLYKALMGIVSASLDDNMTPTADEKKLYKEASNQLNYIFIEAFSLPVETKYTTPITVRVNNSDVKMLRECFVTGFSNEFDTLKKDGTKQFSHRKLQTLVKVTNGKDGVKYDYSKLTKTIIKLAVEKYCKIK